MSKLGSLELVNKVLKNIGEDEATTLSGISGIELECLDAVNDVIMELSNENNGKWKPLEGDAYIELASGTKSYSVPSSMRIENEQSFFVASESEQVEFVQHEDFVCSVPHVSATDDKGYPTKITRYNDKFYLDKFQTGTIASDYVTYNYWAIADQLTTGSDTQTCWLPEGFDNTLLTDLATYRVALNHGKPQAAEYYRRVYGTPGTNDQGSLGRFKSMYSSPVLRHIPVRIHL